MRVLVGIPTYKRQRGLERLLERLCRKSPGINLTILVVDNDSAMSALPIVQKCSAKIDGVRIIYDVEPRRGIVHVRNRILSVAKCERYDFIAFIDDDEWPAEGWLTNLVDVANRYGFDVVGGPVIPVFVVEPPSWLRRFYERRRFPTGILARPMVSTGNVLVRVQSLRSCDIQFDVKLNLTGGEDVMFFLQLWKRGLRFGWADDAVVYEEIPHARLTINWILRRAVRTAGTAYRIRARLYGIRGKVYAFIGGVLRLVIGSMLVLVGFWSRSLLASGLWHVAKAGGTILAAMGWVYREYAAGTTPLNDRRTRHM